MQKSTSVSALTASETEVFTPPEAEEPWATFGMDHHPRSISLPHPRCWSTPGRPAKKSKVEKPRIHSRQGATSAARPVRRARFCGAASCHDHGYTPASDSSVERRCCVSMQRSVSPPHAGDTLVGATPACVMIQFDTLVGATQPWCAAAAQLLPPATPLSPGSARAC